MWDHHPEKAGKRAPDEAKSYRDFGQARKQVRMCFMPTYTPACRFAIGRLHLFRIAPRAAGCGLKDVSGDSGKIGNMAPEK